MSSDRVTGDAAEVPRLQIVESALDTRKRLGAYYTPRPLAEHIARWAIRDIHDTVLDPSFGGLVFLEVAVERLCQLGLSREAASAQVYGIDVDEQAHWAARGRGWMSTNNHLRTADFFRVAPGDLPPVIANVGNPPYVRYQRWSDDEGLVAAACARAGVKLSRRASLWAPFVAHSCSFLTHGGRIGQVLPAEILFADYAKPLLEFIQGSFESVLLVTFAKRVFAGPEAEVVLLLAEGYGSGPAPSIGLLECEDIASLDELGSHPVADFQVQSPLLGFLPSDAQRLVARLEGHPDVRRFDEFAAVDIGVVTGANDFFLMTRSRAEELGVPAHHLRTIVSKAKDVAGADLSSAGVDALDALGRPTLLLSLDGEMPSEEHLSAYIADGEAADLHLRTQCRRRGPSWWSVKLPTIGVPDAFLTCMSDGFPRLVRNSAGALTTNTLHHVVFDDESGADALVAGFYNSLTLLSAELCGRSYGGGTLKLEPRAAESLLFPPVSRRLNRLLPEINRRMLLRDLAGIVQLVDPIVLPGLGLHQTEIDLLRAARERLVMRRRKPTR